MRVMQILRAIDGTDDYPQHMSVAEKAFAAVAFCTVTALLVAGAWSFYVIGWAVLG
jgi:hypothetical protein